jgi:anhydro-N-acetylmuramic acid kinase
MFSIGLMSGTSMDGIDAALIKTNGTTTVQSLGNVFLPYDSEMKILLKVAEFAVRQAKGNIEIAKKNYYHAIIAYLKNEFNMQEPSLSQQISFLSGYLYSSKNSIIIFDDVIKHSTELHAKAVNFLLQKTGYSAAKMDVIGYHGQTLFHNPAAKITLQMGSGELLAELTGITTVNDFRSQDVAMGGQGAPFAPLYHQALAIRDKRYPLAVLNCGGIANITVITGEQSTDIIGFDTGPGNGLIDRFVKQRTRGKDHLDRNGQYGLQGKVQQEILTILYEKAIETNNINYFSLPPPKSLDIGDLNLIPELDTLSLADGCRTLEAFTADTIVTSVMHFSDKIPTYWILVGGGWNNPVICNEFEIRLKLATTSDIQIMTADTLGWNSQAMEAEIFAYLAVRSQYNLPLSLPNTTGVPEPISGGCIHYPKVVDA